MLEVYRLQEHSVPGTAVSWGDQGFGTQRALGLFAGFAADQLAAGGQASEGL